VAQLSCTLDLQSLVLLRQVLHAMHQVNSLSLNQRRLILVVSLDLRDFFVGCLNCLLSMLPRGLRIIFAKHPILELMMGLSKLVLSVLCVLAERLNCVFMLGLCYFVVGNQCLALLVLGLKQTYFVLKRKYFGLRVLAFSVKLKVQLTDLFFKFVDFLLRTGPFFSELEVFFTFIFHLTLLNRVNLDLFRADIFFKLSDLSLQTFDHLLASFKNTFACVLVALAPV